MGISKLIAGTADPFAIAAQRAFLFNISMIKVMTRVACFAFVSLAKRDKHRAGVNGPHVPVACLANAVFSVAVNALLVTGF